MCRSMRPLDMFSDSMSEISYSAGRIPQRLARWGVCILPFFVAPTSGTADDENIEENISFLVLERSSLISFFLFPSEAAHRRWLKVEVNIVVTSR